MKESCLSSISCRYPAEGLRVSRHTAGRFLERNKDAGAALMSGAVDQHLQGEHGFAAARDHP
jgi:hypothetical protein